MTYEEAKQFIKDYDWFKYLGIKEDGNFISYPIEYKVIAPRNKFQDVFEKIIIDIDNKEALIELGLINEPLKIFVVAKDKYDKYYKEDMYSYLLDTSQLGKTNK